MKVNNIEITTKKKYLELMQSAAEREWEKYADVDYMSFAQRAARDTSNLNSTTSLAPIFDDVQYGYLIQTAAELYKHNMGDKYLDIASECLCRIANLYEQISKISTLSQLDFDMLQLIEGAFAGGPFLKGMLILHKLGKLTDELRLRLLPAWESAVRFMFRLPEWGPFNRCALRFVSLDRFSKLYPESEYAQKANQLARFLAEDSLGHWNIEDTTLYNGIWYISITEYLNENNIHNFRTDTVMRFYATYITHLQTPEGSIPDYGDGRTREFGCTGLTLGFLEWAAARYNDGDIKYAASKYLQFCEQNVYHMADVWSARTFGLAADMADANVTATVPHYMSGEVIDDIVSKKIVFRGINDSYMLLNYRDEGNYAPLARQNMYATIPAPAEKVHHGHADENAICQLQYRGKMLLTDGGYRDNIVTDGHYRADFYHNKTVIRNGRMFRQKGFLEYAENLGAYLKVDTQKIFYNEFPDIDVSRTRLNDEHHSAVYDRTICHFKNDGIYAVIDSVKATKTYEYTIGQMWFGGEIEELAPYDYLIKQTLPCFKGDTEDLNLRTAFVRHDLPVCVEPIRRNHDDNQLALSQYFTEYLAKDEYVCFVTLLLPESADNKAENDAVIASASYKNVSAKCMELDLSIGSRSYTIGMKLDEYFGYSNYRMRPTYSFDAGKATYADKYTTDALFSIFRSSGEHVSYSALMLSRIECDGVEVFRSFPTRFANNDLSTSNGAINYVRWDGEIK